MPYYRAIRNYEYCSIVLNLIFNAGMVCMAVVCPFLCSQHACIDSVDLIYILVNMHNISEYWPHILLLLVSLIL